MRLLLPLLLWLALAGGALAQSLEALVAELPEGSFSDRAKVVAAIAASGDARAAPVLRALGDGDLAARKADGAVIRVTGRGAKAQGFDLLTGEALGVVPARSTEPVKVNNALRRAVRSALASLTLRDPDPGRRAAAAAEAFKNPDPDAVQALEAALAAETDAGVRPLLEAARAAAILAGGGEEAARVAAIAVVAGRGSEALPLLIPLASGEDPAVAGAAREAIAGIERTQAMWTLAQNVWFGLSLGSVLLLAAVGLAITFGVMGVINMAHGELIMLGAYTTYLTQTLVRTHAPALGDWSLVAAVPAAFLVAGGVGVLIERGIVRFLYGRPLETLLATWGVSLILQQAVRSIFGPTNREVGNPAWMSGSFRVGEMLVTWNRLVILIFALAVFAALLLLLKRTLFGLEMRAVTQNRAMAAEMGIRTARVDALTFGLGAGIAGLAGVALSQIDNVSPNLGQAYIIDSFLVVVFGGAGNLWGTFAAAFGLGIANKFLEPFAGAVLAKILILVCIILFIQKRPRGLFPQRGRAVDA
jgi:urea transport system permease protein